MAQFSNDKKAPFVDMTPMVDLGFLLITFFMLASAFSSNKMIKMLSPAGGDGLTTPAKCSKMLTVLITDNNKIKYFDCPESGKADSFDYSSRGLRDVLLKRQQEVAARWGNKNELVVLLKAMPKASYNQLVGAIDEMQITQSAFTIIDIDKVDSTILKL